MNARLHERDLHADPIRQFAFWFEDAKAKSGLPNPNAMTLCSLSPEGWPEGRPVLLKQFDEQGFVFYTNFHSEKGRALLALPRAELVFHWDALGRQVRIQGNVAAVSDAEADAYFASRERDSQIGAWASSQSEPVDSRRTMDQKFHDVKQKYENLEIPRPPHWSGFRLLPQRLEFWQADPHRFHDRFRYHFEAGHWTLRRYYP